MTTPSPRRPWRKRTCATVALWLIVAYPLSVGPAAYADARGWVPAAVLPALDAAYAPLDVVTEIVGPFGEALAGYCKRAEGLAAEHEASD